MDAADSLENERAVLEAWAANAEAWISAVRSGAIRTRARVTDAAVMKAIRRISPKTVLDVGCGEGWLCRALVAEGIDAVGVDAVDALVEAARNHGDGDYRSMSYADIARGLLDVRVDAIVCNFSLFGEQTVERLLAAMPPLLMRDGALIIQTLHPNASGNVLRSTDGWREGSWAGCGEGFSDPAPWYFRTVDSWLGLLRRSGFRRIEIVEPIDPEVGTPASLILVAHLN